MVSLVVLVSNGTHQCTTPVVVVIMALVVDVGDMVVVSVLLLEGKLIAAVVAMVVV